MSRAEAGNVELEQKTFIFSSPSFSIISPPQPSIMQRFQFLGETDFSHLIDHVPAIFRILPPFYCQVTRWIGLPSPCLSVNWKAWTSLRVSSTERPTGRSFTVICRRIPFSSMIKRPLGRRDWRLERDAVSVWKLLAMEMKMCWPPRLALALPLVKKHPPPTPAQLENHTTLDLQVLGIQIRKERKREGERERKGKKEGD